jgi:hypothetical protein
VIRQYKSNQNRHQQRDQRGPDERFLNRDELRSLAHGSDINIPECGEGDDTEVQWFEPVWTRKATTTISNACEGEIAGPIGTGGPVSKASKTT